VPSLLRRAEQAAPFVSLTRAQAAAAGAALASAPDAAPDVAAALTAAAAAGDAGAPGGLPASAASAASGDAQGPTSSGPFARPPELVAACFRDRPCAPAFVQSVFLAPRPGGEPRSLRVIVDAASGEVISTFDRLQTATPTVGNGIGLYSGRVVINTGLRGSKGFEMTDFKSGKARTYDLFNSMPGGRARAVLQEDPDDYWCARRCGQACARMCV
jgi:hypothetical protein